MIKRKILISTGVVVAAILSLYILIMAAPKPNSKLNGFTRNFDPGTIKPIKEREINFRISRICGLTTDSFYFTAKDPRVIYRVDWNLQHIDSSIIPFGINEAVLTNFQIISSPPRTTLYAGNYAKVQYYNYGDTIAQMIDVEPPLFTQAVQLPSGNSIIKGFNKDRTNQLIQKIDYSSGKVIAEKDLFGIQKDGGFSLDGLLTYAPDQNHLIYTHYYENKFYCLDTNLNVVYTSKTIDTTTHNKVTTRSFAKEKEAGSLMPAVPLNQINKEVLISDKHIYIYSTLQADNETAEGFNEHSTIDRYNLENGMYEGSFYIPNRNGEKIKSMIISGKNFIAIHPKKMTLFELKQ
ncbi:hypothetical protein [Chitinophaga cymbidii]|nr:hypothetical protein [Chitinophaga cymbidii]